MKKKSKIKQVESKDNDLSCYRFIYVIHDHNREHWVYSNIQYRYVLVRKVYTSSIPILLLFAHKLITYDRFHN